MKKTRLSLRRGLKTSLALVFAFLLGTSAASAEHTTLATRVPTPPSGAVDNGPLAAATTVQVTLYLAPAAPRLAALDQLLAAQQSPSSPQYHQWLTPAQFGAQFGADVLQVAAVRTFAEGQGLQVTGVSASGLRMTLSGTATQMEAAFAPQLHSFLAVGKLLVSNTALPSVPAELSATIAAVSGFDTLTQPSTTVVADRLSAVSSDLLSGFGDAVTANTARVLTVSTTSCAETLGAGDGAAFALLAKEAAAQGITVLAAASCTEGGTGSFPGTLPAVTSVVLAPGLAQTVSPALLGARPDWQVALGLPADGLRQVPDLTVSSLAALSATVQSILASLPAAGDGTPARIGNLSATLYSLAPQHGLFTQPDGAAEGTWEPRTGLGVVDLGALDKFYPRGTLSDNVSISSSNYAPTHGQSITLTSAVTDTSGQANGAVPTGTVTFTTSSGLTLGSNTLGNGSTSITLNSLPGGTYSITANYSGDGTFVPNNSVVANLSVLGEAAALKASVESAVPLGGTIKIDVTATSTSGVGTPAGTASAQPQGIANTGTYTAPLAGANGTSTATISIPATQAGNITVLVSCTPSDASFTCYSPVSVTATVTQGTSTTTLAISPNPPVTGQTTTFTATVTGAASPAAIPTGNVNFYDNGVQLGTGTLVNGTATYTTQSLSGTVAHTFTASYVGDNNYKGSSANGTTTAGSPATTTTTLTINPTTPVYGSTTTLVASIGYTSVGTVPTGVVTFYEDGASIGTAPVTSAGTATFTSTIISGTTSHTFYAMYAGDANYAQSTSAPISSTSGAGATATTTTLTINPAAPVYGSTTTLVASIGFTSNGTQPTGTVTFFEDGTSIGTAPVTTAGTATFTSTIISGTTSHTFYAMYSGDTNYAKSTSAPITSSSGAATATTTTLSIAPTNPVKGTATTLTASVAYALQGTTYATGTVQFYQDGVLIGTGALSSTGIATLTSTAIDGTTAHSFYAVYLGDTTYATSRSATVTTKAGSAANPTTTTVTAANMNPNLGVATTFTATVTPNPLVNNTAPTGTVSFYSSVQGLLGTAPLTGSTATLSVALTLVGYQTISAVYNGDSTYQSSTSTTNPTVTVTATQATQTLTVTPVPTTAIPFGAPITVTVNITGIVVVGTGTTPSTLPVGTENFLITPLPQGTTSLAGTNVALVATSPTTATATYTFTPTAAGSYVVQASCTGTNFQCSITPLTQTITVAKGATTITVTANPTVPVAGQATTLTATIMPVAPATNATNTYGGTVTFYDNGVSLGTGTLVGNTATFSTTLNSTVSNVITAVYSGDTNFMGSTSTGITLTNPPVVTTGTLTSNLGKALQQSNIIFTATIGATPSTTNPTPNAPYGTVTFYDLYNGQTTTLGTATLVSNGPSLAVAQLSTTGLFVGVHSVTAVFNTSTAFSGVTTNAVSVTITDYGLSFNPPTLTIPQGASRSTTLTVSALSGFTGTVVLGCTPPGGTGTTCSFNPAQISTSGTSVLTIGTTLPHARSTQAAGLGATGLGLAVAAALGWLLLSRRRRPALLGLLVLCGLLGTAGCTVLNNAGQTIITNGTSGTPLGTLLFTITTSGSDGVTTNRHDLQYQVTVQ